MTNMVRGYNPLSYQGVNALNPPNLRVINRDPNENDTLNVTIGDIWINKTTFNVFQLVSLGTMADPYEATWIQVGNYTGDFTIRDGNIVAEDGNFVCASPGSGVVLGGGAVMLCGNGTPNGNIIAPKGSFYLQLDGNSTTSRAYINTDSNTAWTSVTTAT